MTVLREVVEWCATSGYEMRALNPGSRILHRVSRIPNFKSRPSRLPRIIHECFCCNRGFAAATSLDAVGKASR